MTEKFEYHPAFPQPSDTTVKAWRYIDLPKLLSMVMKRELNLRRLDLLPDKFEGTFPGRSLSALTKAYSRSADQNLKTPSPEEVAKAHLDFTMQHRKRMYVNCWHLSSHESEAMWRIYCGEDGIAVVLPYSALRKVISTGYSWIGTVTYLDYKADALSIGNVFPVALHKRREFWYEREARIVTFGNYEVSGPNELGPPSVVIPFNTDVVEKIVVNPYAADWYLAIVRDTLERLSPGMGARVVASDMAAAPE